MSGKIVEILIAKDKKSVMQNVNEAVLEAGKGIFGDRYYDKDEEPQNEITLIEKERVDSFNNEFNLTLQYSDFRRNIVISNCDLNTLVNKEFYIGNVLLKGLELCEPCESLADKTSQDILTGLENKAGLRACILKDGNISLSSQLEVS